MWYKLGRAKTKSGSHAYYRQLAARRYRRAYARDKARERLGEKTYLKLRRNAISARRSWEDSQTVFNAAMARLFYIARCEIVAGLAGPYPLSTV